MKDCRKTSPFRVSFDAMRGGFFRGRHHRVYAYEITQTNNPSYFAIAPDDPRRFGYLFNGWYTERELINRYDFSTPLTHSINLFASWTVDPSYVAPTPHPMDEPVPTPPNEGHRMSVTYDARGGMFSNGAERIMYNDAPTGLIAPDEEPTRNGYVFTNWYHDENLTDEVDFYMHLARYFYLGWATLYAGWTPVE
jgi:uncharacterized repeat protein (TIGR02543 family)